MIPERARVGVVGGGGRMGSWLSDLLERKGHRVLKAGRRTRITPEEAAEQCDVVVVSVPMESTVPVIERIAPRVREDALLMDLTSVKQAPMEAMLSHCRGEVVGLHPLFGPDPDANQGPLTVAACRGRGDSGFCWIRSRLEDEGYRVREIDPAEHDRIMAVIQGVNHFSAIALGLFIVRCGIPLAELEPWSTPAFRLIIDRVRRMAVQPGGLYRALLTENPAAADRVALYRSAVDDLHRALFRCDDASFERIFEQLGEAFQEAGLHRSHPSSLGGPKDRAERPERKEECHA